MPAEVRMAPVAKTAEMIEESVLFVDERQKLMLLTHWLHQTDWTRTLVFARTKHRADKIAKSLLKSGIEADAIHANKSQSARQRALARFKSAKPPVLVATDIAARGLDIDAVSHVINFDLPLEPASYVHRIGRTGRAGATRNRHLVLRGARAVAVASDRAADPQESGGRHARRRAAAGTARRRVEGARLARSCTRRQGGRGRPAGANRLPEIAGRAVVPTAMAPMRVRRPRFAGARSGGPHPAGGSAGPASGNGAAATAKTVVDRPSRHRLSPTSAGLASLCHSGDHFVKRLGRESGLIADGLLLGENCGGGVYFGPVWAGRSAGRNLFCLPSRRDLTPMPKYVVRSGIMRAWGFSIPAATTPTGVGSK